MEFPFYNAPDTATITCCHIIEKEEPILYVSHDEYDGMSNLWTVKCKRLLN